MKWINHFLEKKDVSLFFTKLKKTLSREKNHMNIIKAYFLGGFVYDLDRYRELKDAIQLNSFQKSFEALSYNVKEDNIELYFVESKENEGLLISLVAPVELYESESILDIFPCTKEDLEGVKKELIYSI